MKTELEIDTDNPGKLARALDPSFESADRVSYELERKENGIDIRIETDTLGTLRGATDNAFRLALLSEKMLR